LFSVPAILLIYSTLKPDIEISGQDRQCQMHQKKYDAEINKSSVMLRNSAGPPALSELCAAKTTAAKN